VKSDERAALYRDRPLTAGFPDLESVSTEVFSERLSHGLEHRERLSHLLPMLGRVVDLGDVERVAVVGCGPRPETVRILDELGYAVSAVEPVPGYVERARAFLDGRGTVELGSAEDLPLDAESQHIVFLESVLEHVDSPIKSLTEAFRVLAPGGLAVVTTTNKLQLSPSGACAEFNVRFYNWLPTLVKESFVFEQLHFRPDLANYTPRPAVHWFTYNQLCSLGRAAGFAQFYSHVDLLRPTDRTVRDRPVKKWLLGRVQASPWLRAAALTQVGGTTIMWKRRESETTAG
jgi:ubiquinone/menaquinone biosynthesis C-methylase UbiE